MQLFLSRFDEFAALAPPLRRQQRIAAQDQPLAGIIGMGDLGQVLFIEQRSLHHTLAGEFWNLGSAQSRDPVQPLVRAQILLDAFLGKHAAVSHQDDALQVKALAQLGNLCRHGLRIAGVALEDLDGHRTALGRGEDAEDDLRIAPPLIARVAAGGDGAVMPFKVSRGQIIEHERAVTQVPPGWEGFYGFLSQKCNCT